MNGAPRRPPLILIVGPTATGKTSLGLELARTYRGELIGADAYQIYRGMDIGTATPTAEELGGVAHHLIDVADPDEHFDAHRYVELADAAITEVAARGRAAIVVGGAGLYLRSLIRGLAAMPGADAELRARLYAQAEAEGSEALHRQLAEIDPAYAAVINERDLVRIIRALEVYQISGRPISELHAEHRRAPDRYRALWLGLDPGLEALRPRIERRTEAMFAGGFIDEVRRLLDAGYGPELAPLRALGYPAVCRHLAGEIPLDETKRLTNRDTARYSRRQRNWFRTEHDVRWIKGLDAEIERAVGEFIEQVWDGTERAEGRR
jgi:tRNA dimethylallyltransferase